MSEFLLLAMRGCALTNGLLKRAHFMSPKTNLGLPAFGSGLASRFSRALVALALWLAVVAFAPLSRAVTFTGNVLISEGVTTYDGRDIIVDGATVTINGAHSFTSLSLIDGAVRSRISARTLTRG